MFKICKHQLLLAFSTPKTYIAIFIGCAMQIISLMPLLDLSKEIKRPLCIFEGYIYFCCDTYIISAAFLGMVLLISEIPFSTKNEAYTLLRGSRRQWTLGKILYLFSITVIYYFIVMIVGMIFMAENAYIANFWSEPICFLAKNPNNVNLTVFFPYKHLLLITPLKAIVISLALNVSYGFVMSLLIFLLSLKISRSLSYVYSMMVHVIGYIIAALFISLDSKKYSILAHSLLMYHDVQKYYENILPTFWESFMVFGFLTVILTILILRKISNYDFKIVTEEKDA